MKVLNLSTEACTQQNRALALLKLTRLGQIFPHPLSFNFQRASMQNLISFANNPPKICTYSQTRRREKKNNANQGLIHIVTRCNTTGEKKPTTTRKRRSSRCPRERERDCTRGVATAGPLVMPRQPRLYLTLLSALDRAATSASYALFFFSPSFVPFFPKTRCARVTGGSLLPLLL